MPKTKTRKGVESLFKPKSYDGLNRKRMKKGTAGGKRVIFQEGSTVVVQFLVDPRKFKEYDEHQFRDGSRWNYVPDVEEGCPLCSDEDREKSKTHYKFLAPVYDFTDKKVKILAGPKDLAGRIFHQYRRHKKDFLKRTFEVTAMPGSPRTYQVDLGEDKPVNAEAKGLKIPDLDDYLVEELKSYYGEEGVPSSLDEDDDEEEDEYEEDDEDEDEDEDDEDEDDDDEDDEEEDDEDEDDEDELDDDEDDEDEDEEDDEDEPPAKTRRAAKKKTPAKKAAATKKAATKQRAPAKRAAAKKKKKR